jgi:hypothetical protein
MHVGPLVPNNWGCKRKKATTNVVSKGGYVCASKSMAWDNAEKEKGDCKRNVEI